MLDRILVCSEFSLLNTGYSTYYKELLTHLHASGQFEVAEYASFIKEDDERIHKVPWKVYGAIPSDRNPISKHYNHNSTHQFGSLLFDDVCIDFRPTHVIDIRDYWMKCHEASSPARKYFKWIIMPTVDAYPQSEQWLSTYKSADCVLTYQDWSKRVLEKAGINVFDSAPPVASDIYYPLGSHDKEALQAKLGFRNKKVMGTVMRNQRRKLFPDLFKTLSRMEQDVVLYCHTSYPDLGWDIPKYLHEYGVGNRVYFTYVCRECGNVFPSLFNDSISVCPKCKKPSAVFPSPSDGVSTELMNMIYNSFDIYVQYSNSEGFGMPQIEAAACGVPVAAINYSAMEDILEKLDGIPLQYICLVDELETGCKRAVPNNEANSVILQSYLNDEYYIQRLRYAMRKNYEEYYSSWSKTCDKWIDAINSTPGNHNVWNNSASIHIPVRQIPNVSNVEYAKFLIKDVLGDQSYLNTYMEARLVRDLNHGMTSLGIDGIYFNEMSAGFQRPNMKAFTRKDAWEEMAALANRRNIWEKKRESFIRRSLQRG